MYKYTTNLSENSEEVLKGLVLSDFVSHNQLKLLDKLTFNLYSFFRRKISDRFFLDNAGKKEEVANVDDFEIENPNGQHKLSMRAYMPSQKSHNEIILFIHGGGWVQGSIDTHDTLCRKIANVLSRKVFSVNYRLSPEYKFPMPLSDVLSTYIWCSKFENKNIILIGDNVGANLCAALCIKLNAIRYKQLPIAQILLYPILSNNLESKSYELFGNGYGLTKEWTKNYIYQYIGTEYNDPIFSDNKFVYPLLEENAEIFPKTLLVSASCDILLDDQLAFFEKLKKAKVKVNQIILPGAIHGFMTYGKYFHSDITDILRKTNDFLDSK